MPKPHSLLAAGFFVLLGAAQALALDVNVAVLRVDVAKPLPISRLDVPPPDLGFAGAALGTGDNQTTGAFLGNTYTTETRAVPPEEAEAAFDALLAGGARLIVLMADGATQQALADRAGPEVLVLNASARDEDLRNDGCRANLLHVAPSRAMLSDAVMQFLVFKKWTRLFLIHGSHPEDLALAEAYRRSATKFGARVVEEREFADTGGSRNTDTGHVMVQRQMPVFTQRAADHDVVLAADDSDIFAGYLPWHTWDARPVAGSAGLRPVSWHPALEAWGATQFQNRFERLNGRPMREEDYQVWLAMRVIGEAVTRTGSAEPATIRAYALSNDFELAAFKGQKLTFRPWNGQLRQPILLTDGRLTVTVSPQEGFLHQVSPLDTLGTDAPETTCRAFGG
ncbi:ABC transporter substrate-binding protein [Paracoccaceae bacterium Fryx2]|nr:ABC transporter substrate-binding protein [Paracoccaceae bacterium Fryx2]